MLLVDSNPESQIPTTDRAMQYGDGCFTTILVEQGKPQLFSAHLQRLQNACSRLDITIANWTDIEAACLQKAAAITDGVLKVLISRGSGGRGYLPPQQPLPRVLFSTHELPAHYTSWQTSGIRLGLAKHRLAVSASLGGLKHLNRLEQVLIKTDWPDDKPDDVLVCDHDGFMIESSASNIFWLKNGIWFTPELNNCGVEGVMRNHVAQCFEQFNIPLNIVKTKVCELESANAVFICNSLMKIVPVTQFNQHHYDISSVTQLQKRIF
ncbi:aminodeoxychorismate lyase [Neptunicella marina]|uniref:Aminodeoxychorismate lyase n=1 Tax=Neptunicella marina TaxID=2125989 RepID=A0A8J6M2A5_9ALTE|nr:aminodeoxychorismate lyase [Neptunicella marina]MBC3767844.1 aminodeoxychorismate lyase [Neptunicella marina]